jgi:hypothetical protein
MKTKFFRRAGALLALTTVAVLSSPHLFAGPPLICHPYAIGSAQSLPAGSDRFGTALDYDRSHLIDDTLRLLTPDTPVIVRMETLRRAAIYATGNLRTWDGEKYSRIDKELGSTLIAKLRERTRTGDNASRSLALFDLGFFSETLRQTGLNPALDGYAILAKAARSLPNQPEIQFALALASYHPKRAEHQGHLEKARAAAQPGTPLAANLETHFGKS